MQLYFLYQYCPTMRFLDVRIDCAFKKVFGSRHSKPVLIDFLNAMLKYEGAYAIADMEIMNPRQATHSRLPALLQESHPACARMTTPCLSRLK